MASQNLNRPARRGARAPEGDGPLAALAQRYAALEMRAGRLMRRACGPVCAACAKVCCRPEMCRESWESPFLALVRRWSGANAPWSPEQGCLGPQGCLLAAGRPPVCHEFLCQAILAAQPDDAARQRLQDLARLLTRAGQRALGGDHLVEIMTPERLARLKPSRLAARLDQAEERLASLERHWR
ncbi:hypothetical protein AAU61_02545 [Desulfocarbo indianensis]|nr:hypothetical protein AAU61_02545 [Desulfocarbo indianensis]